MVDLGVEMEISNEYESKGVHDTEARLFAENGTAIPT